MIKREFVEQFCLSQPMRNINEAFAMVMNNGVKMPPFEKKPKEHEAWWRVAVARCHVLMAMDMYDAIEKLEAEQLSKSAKQKGVH